MIFLIFLPLSILLDFFIKKKTTNINNTLSKICQKNILTSLPIEVINNKLFVIKFYCLNLTKENGLNNLVFNILILNLILVQIQLQRLQYVSANAFCKSN